MTDRQLAALIRRLNLRRWYANQRLGRVWAYLGGAWRRVA